MSLSDNKHPAFFIWKLQKENEIKGLSIESCICDCQNKDASRAWKAAFCCLNQRV